VNVVFWIGVLIAAFLLWYFLSKHFFKIGNDFNEAIDYLKDTFNETENKPGGKNET